MTPVILKTVAEFVKFLIMLPRKSLMGLVGNVD